MKPITDNKVLLSILIAVFIVNQIAMASMSQAMGMTRAIKLGILGSQPASAMEIIMPMLNDDGKTTSLMTMPTITEVLGEPDSGDVVADAMTVMVATGIPFYAPDGESFDDAVVVMQVWSQYENKSISSELMDRYNRLISLLTCNFCCGSSTKVTLNSNCGCAHAKSARGFFKYMLEKYGDTYSDDQLLGEAYRWQAIWYPSGVVQDYLLATGRVSVLGHKTHGGAGSDGMHGLNQ